MNIVTAIRWRISFIKNIYLICFWEVKRMLNFSKKQELNSISLVIVGRNDNYGGDFSLRLQTTLDWNLKWLPNVELIYIEWNQIKNKASDCKWISDKYPNSKCFIVPSEIHAKIAANPEKMPVMEYFAKNLGIRKASNDWILLMAADCFVGQDVAKQLKKLNPDIIYGTHYNSIKWDNKPISEYHIHNKKLISFAFPADKTMSSVVGNFVLTHKKNWLKATGYDETLTNVRAGVDSNGLKQLLYLGLKPMVIGHHYHLDHPESIIHGQNSTHGKHNFNNIPYKNSENWGLINYPLKQIDERIWELQPI